MISKKEIVGWGLFLLDAIILFSVEFYVLWSSNLPFWQLFNIFILSELIAHTIVSNHVIWVMTVFAALTLIPSIGLIAIEDNSSNVSKVKEEEQ